MDTQNDGPWKRWFLLNMAIFGISKSMSNFWGVNLFKRTVFVGSSPALASKKHGSSAIQVHLRTENWDAADQACRSGSSTKCTGQKGGLPVDFQATHFLPLWILVVLVVLVVVEALFCWQLNSKSSLSSSCGSMKLSLFRWDACCAKNHPFASWPWRKKTTTTESDNRIFLYQFFLGKL